MKRCPMCRQTFPGQQAQFCPADGSVLETMPDEPAVSMIGIVLDGKYKIESLIGEGGMGAVYRARHLHLERLVAVKVLRADMVAEPTAAARFRREAQAAARLVHNNAVAIHDFGISPEGRAYLVMEYLEGRSLRAILDANGPMALSEVSRIISQVCDAMDTAHRLGVVHRDLKPDNIVVGSSTGSVKVVDFGIAMLQDPTAGRLTGTGMVVGTASYMSPEHCKGEVVDARSDIYSLGVVLYEMITGRVPFDSPIPSAVIVAHVNEPPPPMSGFRPDVPAAVQDVVFQALAKSPAARPSSASVLAERFRNAVALCASGDTIAAGTVAGGTSRNAQWGPTSANQARATTPATGQSPGWQPPPLPAVVDAGATIPVTQHSSRPHSSGSWVKIALWVAGAIVLVLGVGIGIAIYLRLPGPTPPIVAPEPQRAAQPESPATEPARGSAPPSAYPVPGPSTPESPSIGPITPNAPEATGGDGLQPLSSSQVSEVEKFLSDWVSSAMARDVEWNVGLYGPIVDYYNAGPVPRVRVRADRVRAYEKFDEVRIELPRVHEASVTADGQEFHLVFDKQWVFTGPAGKTSGKVKQMLVLRRLAGGLKIVAEKDLSVY